MTLAIFPHESSEIKYPRVNLSKTELEEKVGMGSEEANSVRIDGFLEREEEESTESKEETEDSSDGKQTIEMTVALGDFDSNPVVSLLEGQDASECSEIKDKNSEAVVLHEEDENNDKEEAMSPLMTIRSTRREKPLIQDITKT